MAINDVYHRSDPSVAPDGELIADGTNAETGAAEVFEVGGDVDVTIYRETDTTDDGTYDLSVPIDAFPGPFHTQQNQIVISDSNNHRLRIVNEDTEAGPIYLTGMEVND